MSEKKPINWKSLFSQYKWLALAIAIAIPAAIIGNYFMSKSELETWGNDIKRKDKLIKNNLPLPWGATAFKLNTVEIGKVSTSWQSSFLRMSSMVNYELEDKFGLTRRICVDDLGACTKEQRWTPGPNPMVVKITPAPKSFEKWGGLKKKNLCESVSLGQKEPASFAQLLPYRKQKNGPVVRLYIFVCVDKWKKAILLKRTPIVNEIKKYGKDQIARHELMHLYFHKHPKVGGGVTHQPPSYSGGLDKYGSKIFEKWILPGYKSLGLVDESLRQLKYRKLKKTAK